MKITDSVNSVLTDSKLFMPINLGPITLPHRVVMAPLTRLRSAQPGDIPTDLMAEMYAQRATDKVWSLQKLQQFRSLVVVISAHRAFILMNR